MQLSTASTEEQLGKVKELYLKSFPEEELKPFSMLVENSKMRVCEILYIEEDGEFLGIAIMALYQDMVLLDYFAIDDDKRGNGIGGRALALLLKRYKGKRFFLEAECLEVPCDNLEQRERRMKFYHRCGMEYNGIRAKVRGVVLDVLTPKMELNQTGGLSGEEYLNLYRNVYGEEIYNQIKLINSV